MQKFKHGGFAEVSVFTGIFFFVISFFDGNLFAALRVAIGVKRAEIGGCSAVFRSAAEFNRVAEFVKLNRTVFGFGRRIGNFGFSGIQAAAHINRIAAFFDGGHFGDGDFGIGIILCRLVED